MSCGACGPHSRTGWTPVSSDCSIPCPAAWRRGRGVTPPDVLAGVGAGTPLDRAYGHRLPRPFSCPAWGGSIERDCAARAACPTAWRRPPSRRLAASPMPTRLTTRPAYKTMRYRSAWRRGFNTPRPHSSIKRKTWVQRRGKLGGASGWMSKPLSPFKLRRAHATVVLLHTGLAPRVLLLGIPLNLRLLAWAGGSRT